MGTDACPFCEIFATRSREIHFETGCFFAFTPLWPLHAGHLLIVPKRHVLDPFLLTAHEDSDLPRALRKGKTFLQERYAPEGYNIGVNCGPAGGQTIFHLHVH